MTINIQSTTTVNKTVLSIMAASLLMLASAPLHAQGIPVYDANSTAQQIQQVAAWGKQFQQMQMQLQMLKQQNDSFGGSRNMGALVNNPALRGYLPADYQTVLNGGYNNSAAIRANAKRYGIENTTLGPNTDAARAFESSANQAALNRAMSEEGYRQASQRFGQIQVLLDKINNAPDPKDIADLQARIQVEQVMQQNEQNKLLILGQLQQAQRDLAYQQAAEIRMKSTRGNVPRF